MVRLRQDSEQLSTFKQVMETKLNAAWFDFEKSVFVLELLFYIFYMDLTVKVHKN